MKLLEKSKLIRWLIYLVLVTMVITSVTLSRYVSGGGGAAQAAVAAFVSDSSFSLDIPLGALAPGSSQYTDFEVKNFTANAENNVLLQYEIQIETTHNLPLAFSMIDISEEGQVSAAEESVTVNSGANASNLLDANLHAAGGLLPNAGAYGHKTHKYRLTISWPDSTASQKDPSYSDEIDQVAVKITSKQASLLEINGSSSSAPEPGSGSEPEP